MLHIKTKKEWEAESIGLQDALEEFAHIMKLKPFQNNEGLRGVSAFALYWFVKKANPSVVFEVGTWKGFSTWIIEQAAPKAEVFCFDPIFFMESFLDSEKIGPLYRSQTASYSGQDFSCAEVDDIVRTSKKSLAFFDDHQNKLPRLIQAKKAGIKDIIFDDNTPYKYTHRTFVEDLKNLPTRTYLENTLDKYEVFPALWDIDWLFGDNRINEKGIKNFPLKKSYNEIYDERNWHSYVTYVHVK